MHRKHGHMNRNVCQKNCYQMQYKTSSSCEQTPSSLRDDHHNQYSITDYKSRLPSSQVQEERDRGNRSINNYY